MHALLITRNNLYIKRRPIEIQRATHKHILVHLGVLLFSFCLCYCSFPLMCSKWGKGGPAGLKLQILGVLGFQAQLTTPASVLSGNEFYSAYLLLCRILWVVSLLLDICVSKPSRCTFLQPMQMTAGLLPPAPWHLPHYLAVCPHIRHKLHSALF